MEFNYVAQFDDNTARIKVQVESPALGRREVTKTFTSTPDHNLLIGLLECYTNEAVRILGDAIREEQTAALSKTILTSNDTDD